MPITTVVFLLMAGVSPAAAATPTRPTIATLTATPAKLLLGQSSTLSWSVTGATTLTMNSAVGAVTGTSVTVKPSATTTYALTATNTSGSATATVTVTVGSPPVITGFKATPANLTAGQSSALSWTATGSPTFAINSGVGAVAGTSVTVKPSATTTYFLTALNAFGASAAAVTVGVGSPPTITRFTATPAKVAPGQSSTLAWVVTGSPTLSISSGVGAVTGTSATVKPPATTSYALTATNTFGSTTAPVSIAVGSPPVINFFSATPTTINVGQSVMLNWNVSGSTTLSIDSGVGTVTGAVLVLQPPATTTYTLTATNSFGSVTATAGATVNTPSPPVINSFIANPASIGPGVTPILYWNTSGAATVSIDHAIGVFPGTYFVSINPAVATTYTLTATNVLGSVTATVTVTNVQLITVNPQLYYTEHALFIIPPANQVTWTGTDSWDSVYSTANVNSYVSTLKSTFPANNDFFFVVVAANNLTPDKVPSVMAYRHIANGIGEGTVTAVGTDVSATGSITGVGVPDICRYNIPGTVIDGSFGVLPHEIGHSWGIFAGMEDDNCHWPSNSTVSGQMAAKYSDDNYITDKVITGDPVSGFTWTPVNNIQRNETETFSTQDLYLQGLNPTFPDTYVLSTPVYNPDQSMSYSAVTKYDQAWVAQRNGVRSPSYQTSSKRLRMGVVYIAKNFAEVQAVYQPVERSINDFVNSEQISLTTYRFQVPFLADTQYRASVDALLADLDGNRTPTLSIPGATYLVSSDGTATVPFTAADPDGPPAPVVSCVPASPNCSIAGGNVVLTGLASGTHFITIKAQDAGGKKTFAHFVVDVQ